MMQAKFVKLILDMPEHILLEILKLADSRGVNYFKLIEIALCDFLVRSKEKKED